MVGLKVAEPSWNTFYVCSWNSVSRWITVMNDSSQKFPFRSEYKFLSKPHLLAWSVLVFRIAVTVLLFNEAQDSNR